MTVADWVQIGIAGTMLFWATWQDIRDYTIPVLAILLGIVAGLGSAVAFHGWHGLEFAGIGGVLGGVLGGFLVRVVKLGEGDAALYLALGVILGPVFLLSLFVWSNIFILMRFLIPILKKERIRIAVAPYILAATGMTAFLHIIGI